MSGYVLKNNKNFYVTVTATNKVQKVTDLNTATVFATKKDAMKLRAHAPSKLKSFSAARLDKQISIHTPASDTAQTKAIPDITVVIPDVGNKPVQTHEKRKAFSHEERISVYTKAKGRCAICGEFVSPDEFTVDHIIPLAKGGTNDISNLQCACRTCNMIKQDILPEDLMEKLTQIMAFQLKKKKNKKFRKIMEKICRKEK